MSICGYRPEGKDYLFVKQPIHVGNPGILSVTSLAGEGGAAAGGERKDS